MRDEKYTLTEALGEALEYLSRAYSAPDPNYYKYRRRYLLYKEGRLSPDAITKTLRDYGCFKEMPRYFIKVADPDLSKAARRVVPKKDIV